MRGVLILNETQRGTSEIAVKMLCAEVLLVSTDWQDVQIIPFLPAILSAVASCVLHHLINFHH